MRRPIPQRPGRGRARAAIADVLSAGGLLTLALDLFAASSYKVTALGLGFCVVGGFLRVGGDESQ